MKKAIFIITTVFIMLITSRFVIRIVDATVQIDNDIAQFIILLIVLNVVIGMLSRFLYKKIFRGKS
jgi:flagellar biosynthesis protein FliQ